MLLDFYAGCQWNSFADKMASLSLTKIPEIKELLRYDTRTQSTSQKHRARSFNSLRNHCGFALNRLACREGNAQEEGFLSAWCVIDRSWVLSGKDYAPGIVVVP